MNIAILIPTLAYGGAERVAAEVSKYFSQNGHSIYIFTESEQSEKYDFKGHIITLKNDSRHKGNLNKWHGTIYELVKRASEMRRLKKQYKIQISISFMEFYNMINILSRASDKVIVRVCTVLSACNYTPKVYSIRLIRLLYNKADRVIAISNYIKRDLVKKYNIRKERISVIPNSVETFEESNWEVPWVYGEDALICLARLCNEKQQKLLIEIFLSVKRNIPSAKLLLVGNDEGGYALSVKKAAQRSDMRDDIVFTGHISNTKYYLKHSKVFVLLSKVEGFGNSTIEALSMGVPAICMDAPGASREILAPHTKNRDLEEAEFARFGVLVPFVDEDKRDEMANRRIEAISKTIVGMLKEKEVREKYTRQGKKRASMFSMSRIGKMWDKVLED